MQSTAYKILSTLFAAALLATAVCSCQKHYAFDRPLGLTSRAIKLTQYEGSTHIIVYSSGKWGGSLRKNVDWAQFSVLDDGEIGDILFSYSQNEGINRKAVIDLFCDGVRDSIIISQSGANTNPQLAFEEEIITAQGSAGTLQVPIISNVMGSLDQIYPFVKFYQYGEPGPVQPIDGTGWIKSCIIEDNIVYLELTKNSSGEKRVADFMLRLNNELDVDFTVTTRIRQNAI